MANVILARIDAKRTACRVEGLEWFEPLPAAAATRAGDLLFVSGQTAAEADGRVAAADDAAAQAGEALDRLGRVVESAGGTLDDVVDVMSFHRDVRTVGAVMDVARERFRDPGPAWTAVGSVGLPAPGALVSVRAIAHLGPGAREGVTPDGAAWMRGLPLSAGARKGDLVFVSGQSGLRADGRPSAPGDHAAQARLAYARGREVVEALGATMDDVIDICSFHLDPRGMVPCERVHMEVWEGVEPGAAAAWTAIGVPGLMAPGALSAYRLIADAAPGPRVGRASASIHWRDTPNAGASRKQGGRLVGIAGEVASDAEGNVTTPGDTFAQARYALRRIREVVELHGGTMDDVVEITSFHRDPRAWEIVMEAAREFFPEPGAGPAWTPTGATGLWNPGYLHEIYALAVL